MPGIAATEIYGDALASRVLAAHASTATALGWSVIALETAFPLALLGTPLTAMLLAGGLAFHVGGAVFMRLNTFLWAFVATYPAILFSAGVIRQVLRA